MQDLDADLERDEGSGPDDRRDLRAVVDAARDPDPAARVRRLEVLVDMDAFLTFMAMERMTCHWDGYSNNANNYRVYFDPRRGKAVFLPHGMDQMFGEPEFGLFDPSDKVVSGVVMQSDDLRRRYRRKVEGLIPLMSPADGLIRRVDEIDRRIGPAIEAIDRDQAAGRATQVAELKERLVARAASLRRQIAEPEESPQEFDGRGHRHPGGRLGGDRGRGLRPRRGGDGPGGEGAAHRGRRRRPVRGLLEASASCWPRATIPSAPRCGPTGSSGRRTRTKAESGAGISGVPREQHLDGTTDRKVLIQRFQVREDRSPVVLVLELKARSGQAWFDVDSLRLIRDDAGGRPR